MQRRIPIKNHQREIQLTAQRALILLIAICVLIFLLIIRLGFLQIYKHDVYTTLSTQNWLDLVPIEPSRGLIYDRNGVLLADNTPVFSLDVIPDKVTDLEKTITTVKKIIELTDNDIIQFRKQLKQHRRFDEIPLKLRLTEEEVATFAENQHLLPGVIVQARLIRRYPFGETFSHVLGYVGRINAEELSEIDQTNYSASHYIGKLGIEKYYEDELHGNVGYQEIESDASSRPVRILKEIKPVTGKNLYLTLDSGLQLVGEKALEGHRGAVVAIEPSTGQVLAMVSKPGYDPNLFVIGISQKDYQALQTSLDRPLFNRALRGLYPLASTIKPYLALEGLNSDVITPEDTIYDPGWFELRPDSHRFRDWLRTGHGSVDLNAALVNSCDVYFYTLSSKLGIRRMDNILNQFGFGNTTGIDLDDEVSGIVASPEWKRKTRGTRWYEGDTIISAIGQGYMQATPLQLASAVATLANRGQRFMPQLLLGEQLPNQVYAPQQPIPVDNVKIDDKEVWDTVINAMRDVVNTPHGTAYKLGRNSPYIIAGKTGTGQVIATKRRDNERDNQNLLPERLRDHHLFIAFAPIDKPKIAIAIISENSYITLDVAKAMFDYYLGNKQNVRQPETKTEQAST